MAPSSSATTRDLTPAGSARGFATTPLGVRVASAVTPVVGTDAAAGTAEVIGRGLSELLGADLSSVVNRLSLEHLVEGELTLVLNLRDAKHYVLDRADGPPLKVRVPRSAQGTAACLRVTVGSNEEGAPVLKALDLGFGSKVAPADRQALAHGELPRLQNLSALEPSGDDLRDALVDATTAVPFRGLSVDGGGSIVLDADVSVLGGLFRRDFQELARDKLPTLNTDLRALASEHGPGPASRGAREAAAGLGTLLRGFSQAATGGHWEMKLKLAGDDAASLTSSGRLVADSATDLRLQTTLALSAGGQGARIALRAENSTDDGVLGQAQVEVSRTGREARTLSLSWDGDGARPGDVDLRAVLPTHLMPWSSVEPAPRVGTAAFKERLARLLDNTAPVTAGNKVRFVRDGAEVLGERLRLIESAGSGQTVALQTFILHDDVTGSKVVDALIAARARGAEVKVLVDSFGSAEKLEDLDAGNAACRRLRAGGVDVELHKPPSALLRPALELLRGRVTTPDVTSAVRAAFPATARALDAVRAHAHGALVDVEPHVLIPLTLALVDAARELARHRDHTLPTELRVVAGALAPLLASLVHEATSDGPAAVLRQLLPELGREHRKLLAVYGANADGTVRAEMMVGGNNVDDLYQLEPGSPHYDAQRHGGLHLWNDADLVVEGRDAVAAAVAGFRDTFPGEPPAEVPAARAARQDRGVALRVVHHVPEAVAPGKGDNHFDATLLATLEGLGGGDHLAIETPFFVPLPEVHKAMVAAADRGARIDVVTNGVTENNTMGLNEAVARHTRQFVLPSLVEHPRISVYETLGSSQPVHRKTLVARTAADAQLYVVGSANMDRLSSVLNRELFVVGGSAASDAGARSVNDEVARELWRDLERDTHPGYSRKLSRNELKLEAEQVIAGYARSILSPVF